MTAGPRVVRKPPTPGQLSWVGRSVGPGARVIRGRRMRGGITSSVDQLSVRLPGGASVQVVLKRFTDPGWGDLEAIVRNEAAALAATEGTDIPAPGLLGASPDGAETGGVPSLLMRRAPGHVWLPSNDLEPWIRQLADLLPSIHARPAALGSRGPRDPDALTVPTSARRPDVWMAARRVVSAAPPPGDGAFVHGDYQHFNVLWSRGRLSALVDWGSARSAPADVDVGHCRLNLAVLYSSETAERFRLAYESAAGRRVEPWWDIHQLLAYDDSWRDFIPIQVAGRAAVDAAGMTGRVEELLRDAMARL